MKGHGLTFSASAIVDANKLISYVDADWAGDIDGQHSTSGYIFTIAGGAVAWSSKRQHTVTLSSMEAEYVAAMLISLTAR